MNNPLIDLADLPDYAAIRPEHVAPALDALLSQAEAALLAATADGALLDYDTLAALLDVPLERLSRAWSAVGHLNSVADTPALREAYNAALPRMVDFFTRLGSDERLYARYKALAAAGQPAVRQRALELALRGFVLSGVELQGQARVRFAQVQERLAQAAQRYSENVLDATDAFALYVEPDALAGVPQDVIRSARDAAASEGRDGCKLTLQHPCLQPVLQYAHDRSLREQLYRANVTRASEFGPAQRDNTALIREILNLRTEEAALLGHPNYTALSLVPKMARSAESIGAFLRDLARRATPGARREMDELQAHARARFGIDELQPWDLAYVGEHLKHERYAFNDQEVKQYFALPKVLAGLFELVHTLFGVTIRAEDGPAWHQDVQLFRIERAQAGGDAAPQLVGRFCLDLHARAAKRQGAWMEGACSRWLRPPPAQRLQTPVAHLVCNFAPAVGNDPALLTHDDLITLFHEFGHGLHHLLTRIDEPSVAGTAGVEWDAVELPSQFMENFCWEWDVLRRLSGHVRSGEPLPRDLFERMRAARNFMGGLQLLRQVEYGLVDLRLHTEPGAADRVQAVVDEVRREVLLLLPPPQARTQHTFTHIFSGAYAAGYYSYLWAEVLSADAFAAFEETGLFDPATGERFRREVLETGGSRPAMDSFRAFRGREPTIDALLRHLELA